MRSRPLLLALLMLPAWGADPSTPSATTAAAVTVITEVSTNEQLNHLVLTAGVPVLVKIGTTWCPPCRAMVAEIESFAAANPTAIRIALVDADASPAIAQALGVRSFPTLVLYRDGKIDSQRVGYFSRQMLAVWTGLPSPP